ncbi:NAD(P)H-hydrate dehydratase [Loigolactobacillus backii]|uniref:NAD(P)H-hydrate dehydratase n=1 Tax=Loigolactobacillus backii TaxID=375175 RepID=UPI000C1CA921|nr:NAD(P)H-hydrate dehydratase [Loigolactobacillus backii]PIO83184.1 NAD(P)H-hydrate dehydratase [Loigolactobacillus backii]
MQKITETIVKQTISKRKAQSHKGTYGRVMTIGGNRQFGGAIILSTSAAVYAGSGLVTCVTDPINFASLHARLPEAMVVSNQDATSIKQLLPTMDVVVIGPGLGENYQALKLLELTFSTIQKQQTLIIDGSAISLIASHHLKLPDTHLIFTPHQMEWQRLSGLPIKEQTPSNNRQVQEKLAGTVIVKSHRTEVYLATSKNNWRNTAGTAAMATGGMGDTLTGIIAGFVAQFADSNQAVLAAVYTHSKIADYLAKKQYVVLPSQIITHLPEYMAKIAQSEND